MKVFLAILFITTLSAYAQTKVQSTEVQSKPVESVLKEAKKERKKKVEMCHDCGKPEAQCDCKGEEHKKKG